MSCSRTLHQMEGHLEHENETQNPRRQIMPAGGRPDEPALPQTHGFAPALAMADNRRLRKRMTRTFGLSARPKRRQAAALQRRLSLRQHGVVRLQLITGWKPVLPSRLTAACRSARLGKIGESPNVPRDLRTASLPAMKA